MECTVSVIMPVYNVSKYLAQCLDSVLNQTMQNIEIICVNDASTDHSLEILTDYQKKDERIRIITLKRNSGVAIARNEGMKKAKGKYIYFIDSDDFLIDRTALEQLYGLSEQKDLECVLFDTLVVTEDNETYGSFSRELDAGRIYDGQEVFATNRWDAVWAQFWKKDFLIGNKLFFQKELISEDRLFTTYALLKAHRVGVIGEAFYAYRRRDDSRSSIRTLEYVKSNLLLICKYLDLLKKKSLSNDVKCQITNIIKKDLMVRVRQGAEQLQMDKLDACEPYEELLFEWIVGYKAGDNQTDGFRYVKELSQKDVQYLKEKKQIYLYGAGKVAREVIRRFEGCDIPITALVISEQVSDGERVMGYPVKNLLEAEDVSGAVFVIAACKLYQNVMIETLEHMGKEYWIPELFN